MSAEMSLFLLKYIFVDVLVCCGVAFTEYFLSSLFSKLSLQHFTISMSHFFIVPWFFLLELILSLVQHESSKVAGGSRKIFRDTIAFPI
jgi:hypothetical protein